MKPVIKTHYPYVYVTYRLYSLRLKMTNRKLGNLFIFRDLDTKEEHIFGALANKYNSQEEYLKAIIHDFCLKIDSTLDEDVKHQEVFSKLEFIYGK